MAESGGATGGGGQGSQGSQGSQIGQSVAVVAASQPKETELTNAEVGFFVSCL